MLDVPWSGLGLPLGRTLKAVADCSGTLPGAYGRCSRPDRVNERNGRKKKFQSRVETSGQLAGPGPAECERQASSKRRFRLVSGQARALVEEGGRGEQV